MPGTLSSMKRSAFGERTRQIDGRIAARSASPGHEARERLDLVQHL
jgi:hypothetical protein